MTAKELIIELQTMPDELEVLLSSDEGGNEKLFDVYLSKMDAAGILCEPGDADNPTGKYVVLCS